MSPGHATRLAALAVLSDGTRQPTALTRILGITTGGTTKLIDYLEHEQLVTRQRPSASGDNRTVDITITRRGRVQLARACKRLDATSVQRYATRLANDCTDADAVIAIHRLQVLLDTAAGP